MSRPIRQALWQLLSAIVVWALSVPISATAAFGAKSDWAERTTGRATGATRDYYNRAGKLPWKNFMGDWRDTKDVAQGSTAYATTNVVDDDKGKSVEWDVTSLVRQWQEGKYRNQGFFLRTMNRGGTKPSPYDQHVLIDNVVIAKEYIGPMKQEISS